MDQAQQPTPQVPEQQPVQPAQSTQQPQPIQQQPQPNQSTPQDQKANNNKLYWIIGLAACLPLLVIVGILAAMVLVSMGSAREKAKEAAIKAAAGSVSSAAAGYYDENKTYVGLSKDQNVVEANQGISQYGVQFVTKQETNNNFVMFVNMPDNESVYCISSQKTQEVATEKECL